MPTLPEAIYNLKSFPWNSKSVLCTEIRITAFLWILAFKKLDSEFYLSESRRQLSDSDSKCVFMHISLKPTSQVINWAPNGV